MIALAGGHGDLDPVRAEAERLGLSAIGGSLDVASAVERLAHAPILAPHQLLLPPLLWAAAQLGADPSLASDAPERLFGVLPS